MNQKNEKLMIYAGVLIAGILFYLYVIFLITVSFNTVLKETVITFKFQKSEWLYFTIFLIILILSFVIYVPKYLRYRRRFVYYKKYELFYFFLYSLLFYLVVIFLKYFIFTSKTYLLKIVSILTGFIIIIYPTLKILEFILKLVFINLFAHKLERGVSDTEHVYKIYDINDFIKECGVIINQSQRLGINAALIGIYIKNMHDIEERFGIKGAKFFRKQLIFLLTQNSRIYEPWGRVSEKSLYLKLIQIKTEKELRFAAKRFLELIKKYKFWVYNNEIIPEVKILSFYLKFNTIHTSVIEIREKVKILINKLTEKIKLQRKELVILKETING